MELDHVFFFVPPGGGALRRELAQRGWNETYERAHVGQGTANVCYAFDNAFLELIWLTDEAEARSAAIRRTGLLQRAQWRSLGTCPVGIAYRLTSEEAAPFETWDFRPPYLPQGMSIPMAVETEDPHRALVFQSPGRDAPAAWPASRQNGLQRSSGRTRLALEIPHGWVGTLESQLKTVVRFVDLDHARVLVHDDRGGVERLPLGTRADSR